MPEFKVDSLCSNELVWYKVNMYLLSLGFVDLVRVCSHLCLSRAVSGKECMCWALGALRISCGRLKWDAVGCVGLGCHGVPVAGNTGLVGGSILASEVILSTRKLNKIQNLHATSDVLQYQAGCILQDLQEYVAAQDCILPIDLGSKGSCCIGGNVATNAGGQYYYRYGSIAANLLGLQVVTADGRILDLNYTSSNLKDNAGYKIHQIFVGSEGTLGIITGVSLLCRPALHSRQTALLACYTFSDVLNTMRIAKRKLGETLAAFEWMDGPIVELVGKMHSQPIPLLEDDVDNKCYPHYILVETHGCETEHDEAKMEAFLETVTTDEFAAVTDGLLAQDLPQSQKFWNLRESANPSAAAAGYTYKYDVSLPGSRFDSFIDEMNERLDGLDVLNTNWGHILDGNLHFNVTTVGRFEVDDKVLNMLEPFLFEAIHQRQGSISAEHGLGQCKNRYLPMIHDQGTLDAMRSLKSVFDPNGILNPGKLLPPLATT